jgi:hypothetical protein
MVSDASDPNLPRVQLDEEQDVEGLEADGLHSEEVGGDDAGGLRSKEGPPGDRRPSGAGRSPLPCSTVRIVVADTRIPSFLSSPWMRR